MTDTSFSTSDSAAAAQRAKVRRPDEGRLSEGQKTLLKRLAACVFGGLVLALMVGTQEGTENDFGLAFHQAILNARVLVFIVIGVLVFLAITFRPAVTPYIRRPGVAPLIGATLTVVIAQTVMNWYDPLASNGSGKFNAFGSAVDNTSGLSPLSAPFYDYLAWTLLAVAVLAGAAAIVTRIKPVGYVCAAAGVVGAVLAYYTHDDVVSVAGGLDHSLGVWADVIGFAIFIGAGISAVHSQTEVADPRAFLTTLVDYRPGILLTGIAVVWGLLAFFEFGWFGQTIVNWTISDASDHFDGSPITALTSAYLGYLGYVLFAVCAVLALVATYLRQEIVGWVAAVVSLVAVALTFATVSDMTNTAADVANQYGASWKNLGAGGFIACMCFSIFAAASLQAASAARATRRAKGGDTVTAKDTGIVLPMTALVDRVRRSAATRTLLLIGIAVALFYPPTLPVVWQNVLVSQIGVYVLLAVGLNVVVGWAGLLDLGYIAFYEIGAYTTAYLVGALPTKPPSWLHMSAFVAIPFAVIACLIAGVLLGAPTLRLRGDYLAIVTLGFGEIIQIVAVNNPGGFTGGPVGPTIPHPKLNFFGLFKITFGEDNLPYWYLLLILLVVVIVLFYRIEGSRIGRAWAAIREDEVAAQATGINTTRTKLLAFAIGASTSGLAGWFFSTQVGYFDPSLFTLQASILIVAYVVFGGMGSLAGAMAGAAVLTWLPQFLKSQVPAADRQMWVGALVLAMMIFRPAGLLPAKRRRAELEGLDAQPAGETRAVPAAEGL